MSFCDWQSAKSRNLYSHSVPQRVNRLKRQQRDINVIPTISYERRSHISNQTSIQCRYNLRRFDYKSQRSSTLVWRWVLVDEIDNGISTLLYRRKRYVDPICISIFFNVDWTSLRWFPTLVQRLTNVIFCTGKWMSYSPNSLNRVVAGQVA